MLYRVVFLSGSLTGQRVTIGTDPVVFGTDPECHVVLDDPECARRHAEFVHRGDVIEMRDLDTMNHVLVNQRETTEARLKHNDVVEIGRTRLIVQCSVQAAPPGGPQRSEGKRRSRARRIVLAVFLLLSLIAAVMLALENGRPTQDPAGGKNPTNIITVTQVPITTGSVVIASESQPRDPPPPPLPLPTNIPPPSPINQPLRVATHETPPTPVETKKPIPRPVIELIKVDSFKYPDDARNVKVVMRNISETSIDVSKLRVNARVFKKLDGAEVQEKTIQVNPPWRAGETNTPSVEFHPCPTPGYCEVEVIYDGHLQGSSRCNW